MLLRQVFDSKLAQYAYLIGCQQTGEALVIDPERDIDRYIDLAASEGLRIVAVTETHIHADFLSGAREFADCYGVKVYLSDEGDEDWKYAWVEDGEYNHRPLKDGDSFRVGNIELRAVHTPGHTPEHLSFLVVDHGGGATEPMGIASGDFVFVGDLGRPDLLESAAGQVGAREPSARTLFHSAQEFLSLPDYLQVWPGHGAGSACGKALGAVPFSTVGYERQFNPTLGVAMQGENVFIRSILDGQPEPPIYFARMKRLNKEGPPLLGRLPQPQLLSADEFKKAAAQQDYVVLDTRLNRRAFMERHREGSLFTPLDKSFPTVAGSYVREEETILLVVDGERAEEAVRDLIRIGLDNIGGFIEPDTLLRASDLVSTPVIGFAEVAERRHRSEASVLDVRGAAEYAAAHLPGAINIAHTRLLDHLGELPTDKELLVHCGSGARAAVAAALLERAGHPVRYVDDAISNWAPGEVTED